MPIQLPNLDDRSYRQLVDEMLARVPVHTPEWTQFGEADPGVTLLELFAFLGENLLYRANQIPERNRLKFLQLLNLPLQPATPARALVTLANARGPLAAETLPAGLVLKAGQIEQRIVEVINGWLAAEGAQAARLLDGANLDLAVARGAAYYGHVRQGRGVRIRGGTAQSYYVGVESNMPAIPGMEPPLSALCLAPFGMEEGTEVALPDDEFGLVVGEPVRLRFFGSSVRRTDQVGTMLDFWSPEELVELQEIELNLPAAGRAAGEVVPVTLAARVTDIGTLELNAVPVGGSERWKVEFDVRGTPQQ